MIDTNSISAAGRGLPALPATWNAWHIVALGAGAFLMHAYHVVVNAGGVKTIWRKFWGPADQEIGAPGNAGLPSGPAK